jgi:hypothetical protein
VQSNGPDTVRRAQALVEPAMRGLGFCALCLQVQVEYRPSWPQSGGRFPSHVRAYNFTHIRQLQTELQSRHGATRIMASTCVAYVKYPDFEGAWSNDKRAWAPSR